MVNRARLCCVGRNSSVANREDRVIWAHHWQALRRGAYVMTVGGEMENILNFNVFLIDKNAFLIEP